MKKQANSFHIMSKTSMYRFAEILLLKLACLPASPGLSCLLIPLCEIMHHYSLQSALSPEGMLPRGNVRTSCHFHVSYNKSKLPGDILPQFVSGVEYCFNRWVGFTYSTFKDMNFQNHPHNCIIRIGTFLNI